MVSARVSSHDEIALDARWELAELAPDRVRDPAGLAELALDWQPAPVPGTVASARRAAGQDVYRQPVAADARDHWYRCTFARPAGAAGAQVRLLCDGLATLAEVC